MKKKFKGNIKFKQYLKAADGTIHNKMFATVEDAVGYLRANVRLIRVNYGSTVKAYSATTSYTITPYKS